MVDWFLPRLHGGRSRPGRRAPFLLLTTVAIGALFAAAARADTPIDSFETDADMSIPVVHGVNLFRSPSHNTDGDWSARLAFSGTAGEGLHFDNHVSWWPVAGLAFDATTDEAAPVPLLVTISSGRSRFQVRVTLKPSRDARVVIPCDALARGQLEARNMGAYMIAGEGRPLLLTEITGFDLGLSPDSGPHTLYLDHLRLVDNADARGPVLVDSYGQYAPADWPGKLQQDETLEVDAARAPVELAAWKPAPGLDRFGGVRGGRREQRPFFYVRKIGDHWRLVDPDGNLFFAAGVDGVSVSAPASPPAPPQYYGSLPLKSGMQDFYAVNLQRKFGVDYLTGWRELARKHLQAWGFNSTGPDSDPALSDNTPTILDAGSSESIAGIHHLGPFPDVFDPGFPAAARAAVSWLAPFRESPEVIGFTFDHGLPWDRLRDPAFVLAQGGPAAERLKAIAAAAHPAQPEPTLQDGESFLSEFAHRYFSGIKDALTAVDHGHHLYLGCRFTFCPPAVLAAAGGVVDVLTFDCFAPTPAALPALPEGMDRPVLISAFSFGATDRGLLSGGFQTVPSQSARGEAYGHYLRAALDAPDVIGCLWDRYTDDPALLASGPGANLGLVSIADRFYPELTQACRTANLEAIGALKQQQRLAEETKQRNEPIH